MAPCRFRREAVKISRVIGLLLALLASGCTGQPAPGDRAPSDSPATAGSDSVRPGAPIVREDLFGAWLKPVQGQEGYEGYVLRESGHVELAGESARRGADWSVAGDTLTISTYTEQDPDLLRESYRILEIADSTLELAPLGAAAGSPETYRKRQYGQNAEPLIDRMQRRMQGIDGGLSALDIDEIVLEPEQPGWEGRTLRLWRDGNTPIKLTATEPTDAGRMTGLTSFYMPQGELIYVQGPFAGYAFESERLVLWVDEHMRPLLDMPDGDIQNRQDALLAQLETYLSRFR